MKQKKIIYIIAGIVVIVLLALGLYFANSFFGTGNDNEQSESITETGSSHTQEQTSEEIETKSEETTTDEDIIETTKKQETTTASGPDKYTIHIGEELIIPVSGGSTGDSMVINSARLPSNQKQIALTFDAGWLYDQTIDLLNVLDAHQVKSTFFLRGKWVEDHPELAREMLKRGHSPENHSLTHGHMKEMTDAQVRNEIVATTNNIVGITGYRPYLFRPPFGEYDSRILEILAQEGYPYTVMWTVDSVDWLDVYNGEKVTAQYLTNRVLANATDKGIVLMHVGGYETVNALPGIITGLREAGYKLVKVNDMVGPSSGSIGATTYTVKKGDTLFSISRQFGISVDDILSANPNR